jgi:hypothetical protein
MLRGRTVTACALKVIGGGRAAAESCMDRDVGFTKESDV